MSDVLTVAGIQAAVAMLKANNVADVDGYYYVYPLALPRVLHDRGPVLNAHSEYIGTHVWKRGWSATARRRFAADAARRAKYFRWERIKPHPEGLLLDFAGIILQAPVVKFIVGKPKKRTHRARRIRFHIDD